ncbi:MAG TPA: molybdopterin-dependent oxidoreductase [Anaerolineales bacterium]|nr:molybdopterin-dependent oxidoreductase [Anaerolineales bacterium]
MISLTINGQTLEVPENTTVLKAAEQIGIVIPTLCYHKDLTPYGGCRLCSVDIQGMRLPATACTMPVSPGMVVQTESPALTRYRRTILELLLVRFYDAGYTRNGTQEPELDTQFAHWVRHYGIDMKSAMAKKPFRQIDSDPNPFIWVDKNKCIMCTRCVRACAEVQGRFVWTQAYRGYELRIVAGSDTTMLQARCESCGACVAHCPTGALDNKLSVKLGAPDRTVATICPYCGVGCQLYLNVKDDVPGGRILSVSSNAKAPVNGDHLCVKGRYGYDFIQSAGRLKQPRVRQYLLDGTPRPASGGPWVDVDWDTALDIVARGLNAARDKYGSDSIGLLTSGKLLNEENYLMNKLARQVLGTNNIDCSVHINRSTTVDGLNTSFGLAAMSNSMDDIARKASSIFLIGSNITENHPVFGSKIRQAVLRRKVKLIVASPVFFNIEEYAALALRYKRGSEAALLNGLMHIIWKNGWEDKKFIEERTQGFEEFKAALDQYPVDRVSQLTNVSAEALNQAAELMAHNRPMAVIWGSDITPLVSGVNNVMDLANLQMLMGNLGISGGGVAPLRSQNNSQGACDMGGHPSVYSGYQLVTDKYAHKKFETAWGTALPTRPGLTAAEMIAAADRGSLKALFVLGENLWSEETGAFVRRSLANCEFVVLCEVLSSEVSHHADVCLPGVSFAENTGTFTNTERRIQLVRQAIQSQGDSRPAWQIISGLAQRLLAPGSRPVSPEAAYAGWAYGNTREIMNEIAALTPIYAGVSHERLEKGDCLMWPVYSVAESGSPILYASNFPLGKGRFIPSKG